MSAIAVPFAELGPYPPPGWRELGPAYAGAAARAAELARWLPPGHFVDELGDDGTPLRFLRVDEGIAGLRWTGELEAETLGDDAATTTATSTAASSASWWWLAFGLVAVVAIGGAIAWDASRRRAHDASSDRRRERDEFAAQNIPSDLLPLWRQERSRFRGTPHERSEAFLEWAETDEGERARLALLEELSADRADRLILERDGCTCNDDDSPHCCGRGCCSHHKGIRGRRDSEVPF